MIDKSKNFRMLVRLGYAARGLVYMLLGYLALSSAGSAASGPQASFNLLQDIPLGGPVLLVAALGLLAYGAYKFVAAIADVENFGHDAKGIGRQIGFLGSSIGHAALAWTAFEFARGTQQAPGGGQSEQTASALLAWELGSLVLGLVGVGFVLASLHQARNAITAGFMRSVGAGAPGWVCWIGRIGHAARAVVFLVIGWSLIRSAWLENGQGVKGLGEALVSLSDQGPLFTVAAAGLVMFGLFSLIVARFQIIPDIDRSDLKPSFR